MVGYSFQTVFKQPEDRNTHMLPVQFHSIIGTMHISFFLLLIHDRGLLNLATPLSYPVMPCRFHINFLVSLHTGDTSVSISENFLSENLLYKSNIADSY